ncbi:MAG: XisH family protein [Chloroflexi bacterium]|nr:XisH family protein [Chloroflexota bacterium]
MPAIDLCEQQVIRALQKDDWLVTQQPVPIRIDKSCAGYIYADLRLRQRQGGQSVIVVEVKCFTSKRTPLEEFYQAVGQYVVYRNALALNDTHIPVYLSVPVQVYQTFFKLPLIQSVINDMQVNLVVIDLDKEEVIQWRP